MSCPKKKESPLLPIATNQQLKWYEEADREYWEILSIRDLFSDPHPIHAYTERTFFTSSNQTDSMDQYKKLPPLLSGMVGEDKGEQLLRYVEKQIESIQQSRDLRGSKKYENLMDKRYFLLQQKYLSQERVSLRKKQINEINTENSKIPSLELCLDLISPMLAAYKTIPLEV